MEIKEFKKSEVVEKFKSEVIKLPENYYDGLKPTEKFIANMREDLINRSHKRICECWNKNEKSRNFIKHLLRSYLNISPLEKILNFTEEDYKNNVNVDCLNNETLESLSKITDGITEVNMKLMVARATAITNNIKIEDTDEYKEGYEIFEKLPIPIKNAEYAYCAAKSNKCIGKESQYALTYFFNTMYMKSEPEMLGIFRSIMGLNRFNKKRSYPKPQVKPVAVTEEKKSTLGDMLDSSTIEKLNSMKNGTK